jgi:hypothetical protein
MPAAGLQVPLGRVKADGQIHSMHMPLADAMALLGVPFDYARADIAAAFSRKARKTHPDRGGTDERFRRLRSTGPALGRAPRS